MNKVEKLHMNIKKLDNFFGVKTIYNPFGDNLNYEWIDCPDKGKPFVLVTMGRDKDYHGTLTIAKAIKLFNL